MATVTHALTTLAKVKQYLGITSSTNDALIESLINYVTDYIESLCGGRRFKEATYTNEVYDNPDGNNLFLRQYPIQSVSVVEYRTGTISSPTYVAFSADDFIVYKPEGYIHFFAMFGGITEGEQALRTTYVAGYKIDFSNELTPASHSLPFDVAWLATELCTMLFNRRASQGLKAESTEGQSVTYGSLSEQDLSPAQKEVIVKYQKHRLTI